MRYLAGTAIGITLSILAYILWKPALAWTFTRIPPATHPDCEPRYRQWHNGVETK